MYGLVNQALEDYVRRGYGEGCWKRIASRAGLELDVFVSMENYPDETTYRLVGAAAEVLGLPSAQVLEAFGEHWVLYTVEEGYGAMLSMFGSDLRSFLGHLDNLHSHVGMAFPDLRPPSFQVEPLDGQDAVLLHYRSVRAGLAPMVMGLLRGLGRRFSQAIEVRQLERRAGDDHEVFRIDFIAAAPASRP